MLQSVKIENYRCLKSVDVPLRPLTVLIGPNDSGKSAFLAALCYLGEQRGLQRSDRWRLNDKVAVNIHAFTETSHICRDKTGSFVYMPAAGNPLQPLGFYQLPSEGVRMQSSGYSDTGDPPAIEPNGAMIPALLDYFLRRDRRRFDQVVAATRRLVPGLKALEIATPIPAERRIDIVIERNLRLSADDASVGLRLVLFFVALAYHPDPPALILLEEPENGVHPKRLADVMRLLREVSQGVHGGHAAQVIIATHSPHLLDFVDLKQDQVLVFRRNDDGSRGAEPVDAERLKTFLDEFMLGEVWFNEGEEGLVGRET